jgi:hypothetical protein
VRVALAAREVAKAGQLGTSAERGDVTTMSHFNHYSWPASVLAVEQQEELLDTIVGEARARVTNRWHVVPASPAKPARQERQERPDKTRSKRTDTRRPTLQLRRKIGNDHVATPPVAAAADYDSRVETHRWSVYRVIPESVPPCVSRKTIRAVAVSLSIRPADSISE